MLGFDSPSARLRRTGGVAKAEAEYEKFRVLEAAKPSAAEKAFENAVQSIKKLEAGKVAQKKRPPKK
jgi:hypothetical protein